MEVYSDSRYIIFTGNVWREGPITDEQPTLDILFREMSSGREPTQLIERPETSSDDAIIQTAQKAKNADKFIALWNGNWDGYASQSEADLALMGILYFYSKSNEQCRRLFLRSGLGARKKAKRTGYLDRMLLKIRASEPPVIDIDQLIKASNHEPENRNTTRPQPFHGDIEFPPGFVGELASYFYSSAIRPVREVALAAAIALTSGVVGRSYNISGYRLNQYLILLAKTGTGKEDVATGIDMLMAAVRSRVPMCEHFIGPAVFASGQALIRVLDTKPCFVSVLGEFGISLKQLCDPKAIGSEVVLRSAARPFHEIWLQQSYRRASTATSKKILTCSGTKRYNPWRIDAGRVF